MSAINTGCLLLCHQEPPPSALLPVPALERSLDSCHKPVQLEPFQGGWRHSLARRLLDLMACGTKVARNLGLSVLQELQLRVTLHL